MSHHLFKRSERISDLLRKSIARLLQDEIKDPRVQGVMLTHVSVTDDLSQARVFFRCLPPTADQEPSVEEALKGLAKVSGFMRSRLGRSLYLKKIPELHFEFDQSVEQPARIEELLEQVAQEDMEDENRG